MKKRIYIIAIVLALLAATLFFVASKQGQVDPTQEITLINGEKITFASLQGKPLMVVFWATTCTTCVQEMPELAKIHGKGSTEVLAVAMQYDEEDKIRNFISQNGYEFRFTWDRNGTLSHLFEDTVLTPTIFYLDKDGYITSKSVGKIEQI